MKDYKSFKRQILKDKVIRKSYKELGPEFEIITLLIKKRLIRGLSQAELAKRKPAKIAKITSLSNRRISSFMKKCRCLHRHFAQIVDFKGVLCFVMKESFSG